MKLKSRIKRIELPLIITLLAGCTLAGANSSSLNGDGVQSTKPAESAFLTKFGTTLRSDF